MALAISLAVQSPLHGQNLKLIAIQCGKAIRKGNTMPEIIYNEASVQAEYADGFILDETEQSDVSIYQLLIPRNKSGEPTQGSNTFSDILNGRPKREHGQMIRFSLFYKNLRHDIDWLETPANARPVRYKKMEMDYNGPLANQPRIMVVGFGYQYNDATGKNYQQVKELS